jgi:hypothetical protein
MRNSNHVGIALLSVLVAGTGCELMAGIEDRYPPVPASSSAGSSAGGGHASSSTGTAGGGTGGTGGIGGTGGSSACGPSGTTVPVPDSATQFCSHTTATGFCPDETMVFYGQDGNTLVNVPIYQLSQDATEKTLTDCMTALVWQVEPATASDLSWDGAVAQCDNLQYAGFSDWRLPSRRELISLLDLGRPGLGNGTASVFPAELDSLVKPAPANPVYWTRSEHAAAPTGGAWAVRLIGSLIEPLSKNSTAEGRALCVRGPVRYDNPVFDSTADTVTDTATGLIWERNISTAAKWNVALDYCNALDLGGKQDWRLPTLKELAYLADDSRMAPAIDVDAFPGAASEEYWSSSPSSADPTQTWTVHFDSGRAQTKSANWSFRLRCVRTDPLVP